MNKTVKCLDKIAEWSIVILPFSIAIAPAPISIFMGFLIFSFTAKKIINKEKFFALSPLSLPLVSLFAVTCVSIFNSISYGDTAKGGILKLFMYIFILSAISNRIKDKASLKKIIISICCAVMMTMPVMKLTAPNWSRTFQHKSARIAAEHACARKAAR